MAGYPVILDRISGILETGIRPDSRYLKMTGYSVSGSPAILSFAGYPAKSLSSTSLLNTVKTIQCRIYKLFWDSF